MAHHEFGIMKCNPIIGEHYDAYQPEKYHCISVDDNYIAKIAPKLRGIEFYWHSIDHPRKGLAYWGITLIPPAAIKQFILEIENAEELSELKSLLQEALSKNFFVIHYGL